MPDLSATHDRLGALWFPKAPQPETPAPGSDHSLDDLDIERYKAELDRRFAAASRTCMASTLTADQRQYAVGFHNGLREALALMDVARKAPAGTPEKHAEEPHAP